MAECPECGNEFDSIHGRNIHYGSSHGELPEELKEENDDPPTTPEFTEEHREKLSESQQGENNSMYGRRQDEHPRWSGGDESRPRDIDRQKHHDHIRERDDFTCQDCGEEEGSQKLDIHHIDGDIENESEGNLVTLCRSCHIRRHRLQEQSEEQTT